MGARFRLFASVCGGGSSGSGGDGYYATANVPRAEAGPASGGGLFDLAIYAEANSARAEAPAVAASASTLTPREDWRGMTAIIEGGRDVSGTAEAASAASAAAAFPEAIGGARSPFDPLPAVPPPIPERLSMRPLSSAGFSGMREEEKDEETGV